MSLLTSFHLFSLPARCFHHHSHRFPFLQNLLNSLETDGEEKNTIDTDFGDFKEEIDADYVGDPIRIAFNIRYFQDILAAVDGDHLRLEFGSDLDPCVVRIPGRDDCKFIVMPMRLN